LMRRRFGPTSGTLQVGRSGFAVHESLALGGRDLPCLTLRELALPGRGRARPIGSLGALGPRRDLPRLTVHLLTAQRPQRLERVAPLHPENLPQDGAPGDFMRGAARYLQVFFRAGGAVATERTQVEVENATHRGE